MNNEKLGDLFKITSGGTPSRKKPEYFTNGNIPWVKTGDLGIKYINEPLEKINQLGLDSSSAKLFPATTVLVAIYGATIGSCSILDVNACTNQACAAFLPNEKVNHEYLYYFLRSIKQHLVALGQGGGQPNISATLLKSIQIPIPSLDNQIRIAHLLSKVERLIAQRQNNLQQLDDLLKSVFLEMFGDPIHNPKDFPIKKLSEFYVNPKEGTKCGPFGSALKKDELVGSGVPVWNMDNIAHSGRMVLPFRMWITEKKYQKLSAYSVIDSDIIISRAGTVGKMCVAKTDGNQAIISTNLIRLRLGQGLLPLYVVSLMTYCKGRVGRLKTGPDGAFTHMNTGILNKLEFPYPPINLQNRFAIIVEKVEDFRPQYQQSLTELKNLYGVLSQQAFKGELDLSRIVLLTEQKKTSVDMKPLKPTIPGKDAKATIVLPAPADLNSLNSTEGHKIIINQWLDSYLEQLDGIPFSAEHFMETAQERVRELLVDDAPELGTVAYDQLKKWLFRSLESGRLVQAYDDTGNRVAVLPAKG